MDFRWCSISPERVHFFLFLIKADYFSLTTDWNESSLGFSFGQAQSTSSLPMLQRYSSTGLPTKGLVYSPAPSAPWPASVHELSLLLVYSQSHETSYLSETLFFLASCLMQFQCLENVLKEKNFVFEDPQVSNFVSPAIHKIFKALLPPSPLHSPLIQQSLDLQTLALCSKQAKNLREKVATELQLTSASLLSLESCPSIF